MSYDSRTPAHPTHRFRAGMSLSFSLTPTILPTPQRMREEESNDEKVVLLSNRTCGCPRRMHLSQGDASAHDLPGRGGNARGRRQWSEDNLLIRRRAITPRDGQAPTHRMEPQKGELSTRQVVTHRDAKQECRTGPPVI